MKNGGEKRKGAKIQRIPMRTRHRNKARSSVGGSEVAGKHAGKVEK